MAGNHEADATTQPRVGVKATIASLLSRYFGFFCTNNGNYHNLFLDFCTDRAALNAEHTTHNGRVSAMVCGYVWNAQESTGDWVSTSGEQTKQQQKAASLIHPSTFC